MISKLESNITVTLQTCSAFYAGINTAMLLEEINSEKKCIQTEKEVWVGGREMDHVRFQTGTV